MSKKHNMLGFDRADGPSVVTVPRAQALEILARSDAAVAAVKSRAAIPEACGPDIAPAPARGAFATFRPVEIVPGSAGTARPAGYRAHGELQHRSAIRKADVFDAMIDAARKRHIAAGDDAVPFIPPFTPGQVQVARDYRDLTERHSAGGIRCASLEAGRGGGSGGEFIDAYVADGERLRRFHAVIGNGAAMIVRRIRPSSRGTGERGIIHDRTLVDMVCLENRSLTDVLTRHGWSEKGGHRKALRAALAGVLDRMQGYRGK